MVERDEDTDAAADFYDRRRKWIEHISEHRGVKHATFRVGYWMAMRMNGKDQAMWWTIDRIADRLGVDRKTVYSAIAELESLRLMIVMRTMGKPSRYLIRLPHE